MYFVGIVGIVKRVERAHIVSNETHGIGMMDDEVAASVLFLIVRKGER